MEGLNKRRIASMYRRNVSVTSAVVSETLSCLGSDVSNRVDSLLKEGRHKELLEVTVNPLSYSDPFEFRDDYLASEILSKYPYLDVQIDRVAVALAKFRDAEKQCFETNLRLSEKVIGSLRSPYTPLSIISMARLKISQLLGSFSWDEAEQHFGFGPGSTTSLPKVHGDAYFKFGAVTPHVTEACSLLGWCAVKRIPLWFSQLANHARTDHPQFDSYPAWKQAECMFKIVPGNRVTTVPKNAKTDRVIAIEPDMNMFIQKGIGSLIRYRLKRVGIDLNDQSRNQSLAKEGSLTGSLCTIDLSSASDTVSMRLVEELLPSDWLCALKQTRSPKGVLPDGTQIEYQKVSSMGNGFTFELESLIFWALCSSVISLFRPSEDRLAVYGDDIICSSSIYHTVTWILSYVGFTTNAKKSFYCGPFRESCGKHYFGGIDVTPFYVRDDMKSPDRLIWYANSLRRWARHPVWGLDGRIYRSYSGVVERLPVVLQRKTIPDGYGDIALFGDFDESRPKWSRRLHCLIGVGVSDVRKTFIPGEISYLLRQLRSMELFTTDYAIGNIVGSGPSSGVCTSRKVTWKVVNLPITQWDSYGDWLTT